MTRSTSSAGDPVRRSVGRRDVTEWRSRGGARLLAAHRRVAGRTSPRTAAAIGLGVGAGIAIAASWATTALYDAVTDRDGIARIDRPALHAAMRFRGPSVDWCAAAIARVFGPVGMPLLATAGGAALALQQRKALPAETVVAAGLGSLLMTIGGKEVVERHRPPRRDAIPPFETSPSFPSGHTLNATAVAGTMAYLLIIEQESNAAQIVTAGAAAATAVTVGMSRVLLGAHWFTDVVTGWSAGTGWLAIVVVLHRLRLTLSTRPDEGRPGS